jgi:ATP-binding cassette subfamily C exporter for protease/lipase
MPQDVEVFPGTVSENIARFTQFNAEDVVEAAKLAGVHDMILHFPAGYDTKIGDGGVGLSGGQKQRLALARAIFGNPNLVVLDEPNSNLDDAGELALVATIRKLQDRKACVLVITHRISVLQATSKLLLLQDGMVKMFGSTGDVLKAIQQQAQEARGSKGPVESPILPNASGSRT